MFKRLLLILAFTVAAPLAHAGTEYYLGNFKTKIAGFVDTSVYVKIFNRREISGLIFLNTTKTTGILVPFLGSVNGAGRYQAKIVPNATGITGQLSGAIARDKKSLGGHGFLRLPDGRQPRVKIFAKKVPSRISGPKR